jgi:hypothetical protein
VDQANTQGDDFDSSDTLSEDDLHELEQSERLGGAGTLLDDESVDQLDGMDPDELDEEQTDLQSND